MLGTIRLQYYLILLLSLFSAGCGPSVSATVSGLQTSLNDDRLVAPGQPVSLWVNTENMPSPNFIWQVRRDGKVVYERRGRHTLDFTPDQQGRYEFSVKIVERGQIIRPQPVTLVVAEITPTAIVVQPSPTSTLPPTRTPSPTSPPPSTTPSATPTTSPTATVRPKPATATPTPTATATVTVTRQPVATQPIITKLSQLYFLAEGQIDRVEGAIADDNVPGLAPASNSRVSRSVAGKLLVTSITNGNREIFLTTGQVSMPLNLTQHPADDQQPDWSPDGTRLAFSSGRGGNFNIYVMDASGQNLAQLTTSRGFDEWPVWSPDGRQIAFVSTRDDGNQELYIMDSDGLNQRRLSSHPADDTTPVWSPDGSRLLFVSYRAGNADLYVIEVTSGTVTQLTADPNDEINPAWSPDGRLIAFVYATPQGSDVYTLPAPLASARIVPRTQWTQLTQTPFSEAFPVWAP